MTASAETESRDWRALTLPPEALAVLEAAPAPTTSSPTCGAGTRTASSSATIGRRTRSATTTASASPSPASGTRPSSGSRPSPSPSSGSPPASTRRASTPSPSPPPTRASSRWASRCCRASDPSSPSTRPSSRAPSSTSPRRSATRTSRASRSSSTTAEGPLHELFSLQPLPGPQRQEGHLRRAAAMGEQEGWITAHCSTVQVVTPYDNTDHHARGRQRRRQERDARAGAPRAGRPPAPRREPGHRRAQAPPPPRACDLHPVTDDMALCPPTTRAGRVRKLTLIDAEDAWFIRVNHITATAPTRTSSALTISPPEPAAVPEHRRQARQHGPDLGAHRGRAGRALPEPARRGAARTCPTSSASPSPSTSAASACAPAVHARAAELRHHGPAHVLPPALAWLWRLVAPRGHANPSASSTPAA
jgi:hypothetical protein